MEDVQPGEPPATVLLLVSQGRLYLSFSYPSCIRRMASNEMAPGDRHNMASPGQRPNRGVYIVPPRFLFFPDELRLMEERAQ